MTKNKKTRTLNTIKSCGERCLELAKVLKNQEITWNEIDLLTAISVEIKRSADILKEAVVE